MKGNIRLKEFNSTNPAVVGDRVTFSIPDKDNEGIIEAIHDRHNYIIRRSIKLSSQKHIIAANIDQAVLVVTLSHPKTYAEFIDRYLVTAEAYHIPAILVFNKIDLYNNKVPDQMLEMIDIYKNIGYPCFQISATHADNLNDIENLLRNKTTLLSGHSGVGKTTLINKIAPDLNLKTSGISKYHNAGKHTTTFAEMYEIPELGFIIDTPGIKGIGVIDIPRHELSHYFPEMRAELPNCKYHNCVHLDEPDCGVKAAVEAGMIAASRYRSYVSLYQDEEGNSFRKTDYN
jgi:ribosome biogenesis GTPase